MYGYRADEFLGQKPSVLRSVHHNSEFYADLWKTIKAGEVWHGEITNRHKNGESREDEMTITPVKNPEGVITHFVAIKQDVTERRNLQRQLLQNKKMECLGRLAGGVAHDFNNLLQAITGFSDLLADALPASDHRSDDIREIQQAAERATDLTRQLLAFSRQRPVETKPVDLTALLEGMLKLLRRLLGEDIVLNVQIGAALPHVLADHGSIEQIIMNLAVNARDAMPQGGNLRIAAEPVELDESELDGIPNSRPGAFIHLSIDDTGIGMDEVVLEHIFEPFFTTKDPDRGTGLGLAVVYGIVQQHGGFMRVNSTSGRGSRFELWLSSVAAAQAEIVSHNTVRPMPLGQGERILFVEDDARVNRTVMQMLRTSQYDVVPAASAAEAYEIFRRSDGRFDLLLVDVVLPDQNGTELAHQLTALNSELKVVFQSGYADDKSRWAAIRESGLQLLQKPYRRRELLHTLEEALHNSRRATAAFLISPTS